MKYNKKYDRKIKRINNSQFITEPYRETEFKRWRCSICKEHSIGQREHTPYTLLAHVYGRTKKSAEHRARTCIID